MALAISWIEIEYLLLPIIGLLAGLLGGLFGIGGGLVMIPAMHLMLGTLFGNDSLHLYKLASLISSVVVAVPAALRQVQARAIVPRVLLAMLPFGVCAAIGGIWIASLYQGAQTSLLARLFGIFMILVALWNFWQHTQRATDTEIDRRLCPVPRRWFLYGTVIGIPSGLISGLLGVAGGVVAVPLQNEYFGIRLRNAIANSTALIIWLAAISAVLQNFVVWQNPSLNWWDGWRLAALLFPGALIGGWFGAALSHRLPVQPLRYAFFVLIVVTGSRLAIWG